MSGALRLQSLPARETEMESPEPASTELRGYSESALFPVGMGMPDLTPSSPNGSLDRLGKRTKDEEGSSLKGPAESPMKGRAEEGSKDVALPFGETWCKRLCSFRFNTLFFLCKDT